MRPQSSARTTRLGIIGFGAITEEILACLAGDPRVIAGILVRHEKLAAARKMLDGRITVVDEVAALLDLGPTVVAECAGHSAVREFGPPVLESGTDFLCASVGALADPAVSAALIKAAKARILIPSGAIAGIDGMLAARTAGLRNVTYTSVKGPLAWKGSPGEALIAAAGDTRVAFFEGTARDAARLYPKNANVGAAIAFAGLGLDRTLVKLVSDPAIPGPLGIVEAEGDFGCFRFEVLAYASPRNPKTSTLTAHSMVMAVRDGLCFSVSPAMLGV